MDAGLTKDLESRVHFEIVEAFHKAEVDRVERKYDPYRQRHVPR
jgi:hypothetical protein